MNISVLIFWLCLLFALYTYFFYPVVLFLVSLIRQNKIQKYEYPDEITPFVSIIMAAYNEEKYIERKILNCLALDYPKDKFEIIIGSDGSEDKTVDIAQRYETNVQFHFHSHQVRRGKMAVINDGASRAKGDILVFSDISEVFDKNAIRKLVSNFNDKSVGAVTGNHLYNPSSTDIGKGTLLYWKYQRWIQKNETLTATILSCDGTIYAVRRTLFVPPPEGTINDDKAVPMGVIKQGYRVVFEPEAIARGDVLNESRDFFKQKVRGQTGMYQLFWLFKSMFWPKDFFVWFVFISHTVGPVAVPWCLLAVFISNMLLYGSFPYNVLFFVQVIFYSSALIGAIANRFRLNMPFFHIPYFFTMANIASLFSFWTFLFKTQKATWVKVE